jgi:putative membrane protein insertion efficiency factor
VLSPLLGQRCKYHPSCSAYAVQAIEEQGVARGVVLAGWRLARCNPWSHGGVDYPADQRVFRR